MELHPGRYDSSIAAEFPPLRGGRPSVVSETLMRNIFCECVGPDRMVTTPGNYNTCHTIIHFETCSIVCTSQEMLNIVNMRLNPRAPWFRPFFVNSMISTNGRRLYRHPNAVPGVIAMILVCKYNHYFQKIWNNTIKKTYRFIFLQNQFYYHFV